MSAALKDGTYIWQIITHLGSSSLMLPILAITVTGLLQSHQKKAVRIWLMTLTVAVMITLVTKIAFIGWGIGIASLRFTGVSGHTLLATSVLPVLLSWLTARDEKSLRFAGIFFGLLVGASVGISRVVLGVHSISEVLAAWLIGLTVSSVTLNALENSIQRPWCARLSPLLLLLAFNTTSSNYLPTRDWEIKIALFLSGHDRPYVRDSLMQTAQCEK